MKYADQIANELTPHVTANNAALGPTNRRLAKIGDGQGNVQPPTLLVPREVFYRSSLDQNDRGVAVLAQTCPIPIEVVQSYYNTDVWIANVPGSSEIEIVDLADASGLTTGNASPSQALARVAAFPSQDRFLILRLRPSGGGLSVYVDAGPDQISYELPGGLLKFFASTDFGFPDPTDGSVFVPTTTALASGEHRLVGITLNPGTGGLIVIPGAAASAANTLPSRSEFLEADYAAIDFTGTYPAGYVYTYYLQSAIVEDDCLRLYDPRAFLNKTGPRAGRTVTATDYTMTRDDVIVAVTNTSSARTITLPPAIGVVTGLIYWIKDESGGAATHNITLTPDGADTIDVSTLSTNYGRLGLYSDGVSAWFTL